jgi:hypothetical protein
MRRNEGLGTRTAVTAAAIGLPTKPRGRGGDLFRTFTLAQLGARGVRSFGGDRFIEEENQ